MSGFFSYEYIFHVLLCTAHSKFLNKIAQADIFTDTTIYDWHEVREDHTRTNKNYEFSLLFRTCSFIPFCVLKRFSRKLQNCYAKPHTREREEKSKQNVHSLFLLFLPHSQANEMRLRSCICMKHFLMLGGWWGEKREWIEKIRWEQQPQQRALFCTIFTLNFCVCSSS